MPATVSPATVSYVVAIPPDPDEIARASLGFAIGARAQECTEITLAKQSAELAALDPPPSNAYLDHRWARSLFSVLLVARYLVTGEQMTPEEVSWISQAGVLAAESGVPARLLARGNLYWRDVLIQILEEEARRLVVPDHVLQHAVRAVSTSADASMIRAIKRYDAQLTQSQELLRANEAQLSNVLGSAPIGLFSLDAEGRWILCRGRVFEHLACDGLRPGHGIDELAVQFPQLVASLRAALEGQTTAGTISMAGMELSFEADLREAPGPSGEVLTGVLVDVTHAKDAEKARRESEAKSLFLAQMSHELRTPLNAILGFAQLLELRPDSLDKRQHRYIRNIGSSGENLLQLVNQILDLSKISAGQLEVVTKTVEALPVIRRALEKMEPAMLDKELHISVKGGVGACVLGDPLRLEQVLLNLLSNAVKFTPIGGSVEIELAAGADRVEISVRDDGIGIPPDQLGRVFEEFTQVTSGITRPVDGTGLGLSISRQLAELMGGSLAVESEEGKGSCFTLGLRAAARPPGTAEVIPAALSAPSRPRNGQVHGLALRVG